MPVETDNVYKADSKKGVLLFNAIRVYHREKAQTHVSPMTRSCQKLRVNQGTHTTPLSKPSQHRTQQGTPIIPLEDIRPRRTRLFGMVNYGDNSSLLATFDHVFSAATKLYNPSDSWNADPDILPGTASSSGSELRERARNDWRETWEYGQVGATQQET